VEKGAKAAQWPSRLSCKVRFGSVWPCENFSGRATHRNIPEQLHLWESNHTAHARFDALLENCVFYISRMYEFLHSQGQTRSFGDVCSMSGLLPKAAVERTSVDVSNVPCVDGSELARLFFTFAGWSVQPCVRPVCAVHMTAGHNAFRGSGPGQKPAFEMHWHKWVVLIAGSTGSALRAVGPPNFHITPDVGAIGHAASATGSL
jgi:hypothetical protein